MTNTLKTPGVRTTDIIILRRRNTGQWTFDYQRQNIPHYRSDQLAEQYFAGGI